MNLLSNRSIIVLVLWSTHLLGAPTIWQSFDFEYNGEKIHVELPGQVVSQQDQRLFYLIGQDTDTEYHFITTIPPTSGTSFETAKLMAKAVIAKNGGVISKSTNTKHQQFLASDYEGVDPNYTTFFKGRLVLTKKNVFYLEAISLNENNNSQKELLSRFKIR